MPNNTTKSIYFLRHGTTESNEYLESLGWGSSNFKDHAHLHDTKLSSKGKADCLAVNAFFIDDKTDKPPPIEKLSEEEKKRLLTAYLSPQDVNTVVQVTVSANLSKKEMLNDVDLVAVSPLTRTLQTMSLCLYGHETPMCDKTHATPLESIFVSKVSREVKVVANPLLRERLFMYSDAGSKVNDLEGKFQHVCFDTHMAHHKDEENTTWWHKPIEGQEMSVIDGDDADGFRYENEWRPSDKGQKYKCEGEHDLAFHSRMLKLYDWIEGQEEQNILLVTHWGVCNWFWGQDDVNGNFKNCEMRKVGFSEIEGQTKVLREKWGEKNNEKQGGKRKAEEVEKKEEKEEV